MPGPLTVALAVAVAGVVGYCLARAVRPALRPADHHPDVDAWHVTLGLAMIAMLLTPLSGALATVTVLASAAGLGWALARLLRRAARPAYLRLAAGAAAMAAMVLLPSTATASAPASAGGHGHGGAVAAGAVVLAPLLLLLLMLVLAGRMLDAARRAEPLPESLDACCDVAMAGATGYLLVLML